jgi:hypothetical protein
MKFFAFFLLCFFTESVLAQSEKKIAKDSVGMIQISGVVVSEDVLAQLPYARVFDITTRRGVITDYYGYFSLVAYPGDTLLFSYMGYKTSSFIVPDTLKDRRYSLIHMLQEDSVYLPEVIIYPWPSRENFARAFVEMEPYSDAFRRAQRQVSGDNLAFAAARLENDASLAFGSTQNQQFTKLYTNGQLPVNNLINPYSWAKFISEWKQGNLKIK